MTATLAGSTRLTSPDDLLSRQLVFVTGKGGVGKSTVTAALAELAASLGKRTLMVEVDAKGNLTDFFEHDRVGFEPEEIRPGLCAMTMNTEDSLQEYLQIFLKMGRVSKISFLSRIFEFVANAAPGVKEILTIGKITYEASLVEGNANKWDFIVVDAAPIGRVIGQLDAPAAIHDLIDAGMVRDQTGWMREILRDADRTSLVAVATPEEMPVTETIELGIATESIDVKLDAVIVNRVLPELFTTSSLEVFDDLATDGPAQLLEREFDGHAEPIMDAARLAVNLRRSRVEHIRRLGDALPITMVFVPYLFIRNHGKRSTTLVADALRAELGL